MILFYSEEITGRMEYIARVIFKHILKMNVEFTTNSIEFKKHGGAKLNYSPGKFNDEIYIKPHGLLNSGKLTSIRYQPVWFKNEKYFFKSSEDSDLPFDIFAASFYLVSRYEEYIDEERDNFNRYQPENSILYKYNLLKKPIVNIWAKLLATLLSKKYPKLVFPKNKFHFISTIDIDNAWAYKNKGFLRSSAALTKDLFTGHPEAVKQRFKVLSGKEKDPYDTYEFADSVFKGNEEKIKFFFLLGDYAKYDKNISVSKKAFQNIIKSTATKYEVGLHPSFRSGKKGGLKKIKKEKERLEYILNTKINCSRQHYLILELPKTYQRLIKAGITHDYTMGYASQTGFRAGICTPYPFYDLKKEEETKLTIIPFQVMDVTLKQYMKLEPEKAMEEIKSIMEEVKNVDGTFVSIWHNETINDANAWKGYQKVFIEMNKLGFDWDNE